MIEYRIGEEDDGERPSGGRDGEGDDDDDDEDDDEGDDEDDEDDDDDGGGDTSERKRKRPKVRHQLFEVYIARRRINEYKLKLLSVPDFDSWLQCVGCPP
jgi:hypothetical protein